jgi:hypothetical protein
MERSKRLQRYVSTAMLGLGLGLIASTVMDAGARWTSSDQAMFGLGLTFLAAGVVLRSLLRR